MIIRLKRFMVHDDTEVELPDSGVVLVTGPNGAGKSGLVEGVATALWGRGLRGRWSPWRPGQAGYAEIEAPGLTARRVWTGKGKGLSWSAAAGAGQADTMTKTQEDLEALVGDFDAWRRTCVFSSSDAAHFTLATDSERKALLERILGLEWVDRAHAMAREDLRRTRDEAAGLDNLDMVRADQVAKLEEAIADLGQPAPISAAAEVIDAAATEEALRGARAALRENEDEVRKLSGAGATHKERARAAAERIRKLAVGKCGACGQEVTGAHLDSLRAEEATALAEARAAEQEAAARLTDLRLDAEGLRADVDRLGGQHARNMAAASAAREAARLAEETEKKRAKHEKVLREYRAELEAWRARRKALEVDIAELEAAEQVLGLRGVRAALLDGALRAIEASANAWLGKLAPHLSVEVRSYTERKSGEAVDAISVVVMGAGGEEGSYRGSSGGERRRVDVALLLALADLGAGARAGSPFRSPIFFDEVLDSLDAPGIDAVVEALREVAKDRPVVLISHAGLSGGNFDRSIRIVGGKIQ